MNEHMTPSKMLTSFFSILCLFAVLTESANNTRLTGGRNSHEGRVEVQYGEIWGTVCQDWWSDENAQVVCNQLGFNGSLAISLIGPFFNNNSTDQSLPILLDDVQCSGTEKWLGSCQHAPWGKSYCNHREDVGVSCLSPPNSLEVRLADGSNNREGRAEVKVLEDSWAVICGQGFNQKAAQVICNQLGFQGTTGYAFDGTFVTNNTENLQLSVVFEGLQCSGTEANIWECERVSVGALPDGCAGRRPPIAGVVCSSTKMLPIRLAGGKNEMEGRAEIQMLSGTWEPICPYHWGDTEAQVVCNQLGFNSSHGLAFSGSFFVNNSRSSTFKVLLDNVNCRGTERWLGDCGHAPFGTTANCYFGTDTVGVICSTAPTFPIRLADGRDRTEGRVEIQLPSGEWGTVCRDGFNQPAAQLVCQQLGLPSDHSRPVCCESFVKGTGNPDLRILLDDLSCVGPGVETWLGKCKHRPWGRNKCDRSEAVGVVCGPPEPPATTTAPEGVVSLPLYQSATCVLASGCPPYAVPVNLTHAVLITVNTTCGNPVSVIGSYSKPDSGRAVALTGIVVNNATVDSMRVPLPTALGEPFYVTVSSASSNKACSVTLLPHLRGDGLEKTFR